MKLAVIEANYVNVPKNKNERRIEYMKLTATQGIAVHTQKSTS